MGRIVVEVMPKPEILDPQGKAVVGSLPRLGFEQFTGVRQGRRFELTVDGPVTEEHLAAAREGVPVVIHEANASAGLANRVGARTAQRVLSAVADCGLPGAEVVGVPVREAITSLDRAALRAEATGSPEADVRDKPRFLRLPELNRAERAALTEVTVETARKP